MRCVGTCTKKREKNRMIREKNREFENRSIFMYNRTELWYTN